MRMVDRCDLVSKGECDDDGEKAAKVACEASSFSATDEAAEMCEVCEAFRE
jgi:hypothetical protein